MVTVLFVCHCALDLFCRSASRQIGAKYIEPSGLPH